MRKLADVNAQRTAYRERSRSNGSAIQIQRFLDAPEVRAPQHLGWQDYFLPRKETRLMSDEAARTGGIFLPWPLLGFILTITMALVAGLVGLYTQISAMNTTLILRDTTNQQQMSDLKRAIEVQGEYVRDLRERVIRVEAGDKKRGS